MMQEMKPEEMESFLQWLTHLCERPAMYMGSGELKTVCAYLHGYAFGFKFGRRIKCFGGWETLETFFFKWLRIKFAVNHPAWGAEKILFHFHDHDERKAVLAISGLFKEYLNCSPDDLRDSVLDEKIAAAYGADYGAPACSVCNGKGKAP